MAAVLDFFFQAEDGIRDYEVTGVQTCALPISGFWVFWGFLGGFRGFGFFLYLGLISDFEGF